MKFSTVKYVAILLASGVSLLWVASSPAQTQPDSGIAWYPSLEAGLAEAKRSNRPILFTSAAPNCAGVSGIW